MLGRHSALLKKRTYLLMFGFCCVASANAAASGAVGQNQLSHLSALLHAPASVVSKQFGKPKSCSTNIEGRSCDYEGGRSVLFRSGKAISLYVPAHDLRFEPGSIERFGYHLGTPEFANKNVIRWNVGKGQVSIFPLGNGSIDFVAVNDSRN